MKPKTAKRKLLRRKHRRYVAALAGAAILAGAGLPGITQTKALAAESPGSSTPAQIAQSTSVDKDMQRPLKYTVTDKTKEYRHYRYSQGITKDPYLRLRDHSDRRDGYTTVRELPNPIDTIKRYAYLYGFNPDRDTFTFLSLSSRKASIQVTRYDTGARYRVDLERSRHSDWTIVDVYSMY